jgi:hypothetical protein
MKTQTAVDFLKDKDEIDSLWTDNDEDICKVLNEFATAQIEALRERFRSKFFGIYGDLCNEIINNFLKEIKD